MWFALLKKYVESSESSVSALPTDNPETLPQIGAVPVPCERIICPLVPYPPSSNKLSAMLTGPAKVEVPVMLPEIDRDEPEIAPPEIAPDTVND